MLEGKADMPCCLNGCQQIDFIFEIARLTDAVPSLACGDFAGPIGVEAIEEMKQEGIPSVGFGGMAQLLFAVEDIEEEIFFIHFAPAVGIAIAVFEGEGEIGAVGPLRAEIEMVESDDVRDSRRNRSYASMWGWKRRQSGRRLLEWSDRFYRCEKRHRHKYRQKISGRRSPRSFCNKGHY